MNIGMFKILSEEISCTVFTVLHFKTTFHKYLYFLGSYHINSYISTLKYLYSY